ncbi:unnamed protein product [Ranitomeya imitator]|uniref:G-protein coupled receptors family 2 profile 2 domain-containing protein n=1 Tax=Ranitomeya imitator TaxID=111125 RepID=A0ABN9MNR2_9NEOB|nr:unnamed protein product [Ranitomeya imitator]
MRSGGKIINSDLSTLSLRKREEKKEINFLIFMRIIQILLSKMRAHQMRYTDYKLRLARSTLTLIPLLGIHEVVFALITDETAHGTLRLVKLFFDLFFSSFQGMLVAVLYCFVNKEVREGILGWVVGQFN